MTETLDTPPGTRYPAKAEGSIQDGKSRTIRVPCPDNINARDECRHEYGLGKRFVKEN